MDEYDTKEKDVMKILVEVATAKREAEIVSVSQKRGRDSKCQSKKEAEIIHVNKKGVDCKCHSKREMEIASFSAFIELHVEIVIIYMSVFMYCF